MCNYIQSFSLYNSQNSKENAFQNRSMLLYPDDGFPVNNKLEHSLSSWQEDDCLI